MGTVLLGGGCGRTWFDLDLAQCGNGIVEPGETCDDGNLDDGDACLHTCQLATCGDGVLWVGVEACDDGNNVAGDGCSPTCEIDGQVCGNGIVEGTEQCDDGNTAPYDGCDPWCNWEVGYCGDGNLDSGEECDDGNNLPGDGCSPLCTWEIGECGNGVPEAGEQCDDGNTSNNDSCLNSCVAARCGDDFVWLGVEQCDDGNILSGDGCSSLCQSEGRICGNGVLEAGEQCDDGNTSNNDGCLSTCMNATCGDGYLWIGAEQCDDGNTLPGDGCDALCQFEFAVCGNGIVEAGEQCDDGNTLNTDACLNTCRTATCGDGALWAGVEQCDDGNLIPGDGCDATCRVEVAVCGNGVTEPGEQCDDANFSNNDSCLSTCRNAACGDGYVWYGVEQCDDGNTVPGDGCDDDCRLETFICGNGVREPGEQCDDGNTSNNDACLSSCRSATCGDGYLWIGVEQCDDGNTTPGDGCSATCTVEGAVCGNGTVEAGEQCDDGNTSNNDACLVTCQNATCGDGYLWQGVEQCDDGNVLPGDGCSSTCEVELAVCGNGIPEAGEQCDDGNTSENDACLNSCRLATCGDGALWTGMEECDDGNTQSGDGCSSTCRVEVAVCGNGIPEAGEQCDDGNTSNNDACLNSCQDAVCGDGYVWVGVEQCDDGNAQSGDGCSATCQLEGPVCGNGTTETGEECDDGNTSENDACLNSCRLASCGDHFVWTGVEQCDDGNTSPGDGCDENCRLESAVCGNGIPETGEECDDGNTSNNDACLNTCVAATCGDTWIRAGVEQCDDGNTSPGDGCDASCQIEVAVCGNGIPEVGEQCDDGNPSNNDACLTSCQDAVCGDGYVWTGFEQCDDGNTTPGDGCDASCRTEGPVCGNGTTETGEQCDDGNTSNSDDCLNTCVSATCGDGFIWLWNEACDDGNTSPGDGCDENCQIENPTCVPDWAYLYCNGSDNWSTTASGATQAIDVYPCSGRDESGPEYTYTFTPTSDGPVALTLTSAEDLDVYVLSDTGGICDPANCLDWGDTTVTWNAQANQTYYIVVDGHAGAAGDYQIDMACQGCGNGIPEAGEECDDGNPSNNDECKNDCTAAFCGDGYVWQGVEQCDDGNTTPGDGCDENCQWENPMCQPDYSLSCGGSDNWGTEYQGATDQVDSYSCSPWDTSGPEYAYTFVAPDSQEVQVNLATGVGNLDVFVLQAGANGTCDPQTCIAYGNNGATFQSVAGQTYYIVVDGRNGASGTYSINVTCSTCGNGVLEGNEECDDGPANETRYALRAWQPSGFDLAVQPIEKWQNASAYYGLINYSAHTGYEAVGRSLVFLYRDRATGILSLFVIHGIDLETSGLHQPTAEVIFDLTGFPTGTSLNRSDDAGEFTQNGPTSYRGDWWFRDNTDGGVVSDIAFPDSWTVTIQPSWNYGLTDWVWVDDDDQFHALDMSQPLYLTADPVPISCRADCTLPRCGDGILDAGEVCDDGNTVDGDGCAADCQSVP